MISWGGNVSLLSGGATKEELLTCIERGEMLEGGTSKKQRGKRAEPGNVQRKPVFRGLNGAFGQHALNAGGSNTDPNAVS